MVKPLASVIIPTHNRCAVLGRTLRRLASLGDGIEIIVADNASCDDTPVTVRREFPDVRVIPLASNLATASRNLAARRARSDLLIMLDDDSYLDREAVMRMRAALAADPQLAVAAALVRRSRSPLRHETGGLPGVFIGCGAGIRRCAFLELGGYPDDYELYAEEYDFCCRAWMRGWEVRTFRDIVVDHDRARTGRDMNRVMRLLARNNLRLWDRYAPPGRRAKLLAETRRRYRRIAQNEGALAGYEQGVREAESARLAGPALDGRLTETQFEMLYGLQDARELLDSGARQLGVRRVALFGLAKGAEQLVERVREAGLSLAGVFDEHCDSPEAWCDTTVMPAGRLAEMRPDALVCGALSPGTCLDLAARARRTWPGLPVIETVRWHRAAAPAGGGS